jgi:alkylation response protein AidB-like acyl-CoA dehydrogenase
MASNTSCTSTLCLFDGIIIVDSFNHERLSGIIHAVRFSRELIRDALLHAHHREAFGKKLIESSLFLDDKLTLQIK